VLNAMVVVRPSGGGVDGQQRDIEIQIPLRWRAFNEKDAWFCNRIPPTRPARFSGDPILNPDASRRFFEYDPRQRLVG
jgi:hypothetical protein